MNVRPLLDCWGDVSRCVRAAKDIRLFLDFDGTLVDFRSRPDQVVLKEKTRRALRRLVRHGSVHTAMVSGRRRAELLEYIKVPGIQLFGLYGWEGHEGLRVPQATIRKLAQARALLADLPRIAPGIYIEDKDIALAVHFREALPPALRCARAFLRKFQERFGAHLHIVRASNVWEVVPREIRGKGIALRHMLKAVREPFLPIYIGDDLTDEAAFKVLPNGITVLVGPLRRTHAAFRLQNSAEVCVFLERLETALA